MKETELKHFEDICAQAAEIGGLIDKQKEEYEKVGAYISDIQKLENMPAEKRTALAEYAKMAEIIEQDKTEYKEESELATDIEYRAIREEETNLPRILKNMEENEKRYTLVKGDLKKLEGERNGLQIEWSYLKERRRLYQGLAKVTIAAAVILMVIYCICAAALEMNMNYFVFVTIAVAALIIALLLLGSSRAKREMKLIEMKINKAIGLENRIKLKFVNAYNGLDFMYEKYDVGSSYELGKKWADYDQAKRKREVYKAASSRLYELNKNILDILDQEKLHDSAIWLTQILALYDAEELEKIKASLYSQRQGLRKRIEKNVSAMEEVKETIKEMIAADPENGREMMDILEKY